MSYALKNFDLATLDWLLQSDGVSPIAIGANDFLIARGDMKGVTDTTDFISVRSGTPPFPKPRSPAAVIGDTACPKRLCKR